MAIRLAVKAAGRVRDARPRARERSLGHHRTCNRDGQRFSEGRRGDAGNWRLSVEASGPWKRRDDPERLFEFLGEHIRVVAIGQPPGLLPPNVFLRSSCEANATILQRDRSSRRITSASMRRPALMSSSESFRARWRAARSSSSSQSPGSRGSSSISVPSGRSVGSSTTSRPAFTRAFNVIAITVAPRSVAQQAVLRVASSRLVFHVGDGRRRQAAGASESLPGCYPSPKRCEIVRKSVRLNSVRDPVASLRARRHRRAICRGRLSHVAR